jgi:hypothetical protein
MASTSTKPTNKLRVTQMIPIVILIGSIVGALYFTGFFSSLTLDQNTEFNDNAVLTPTRDIEGTWKTSFPTQFMIATDFQEFGSLVDVGSEYRTMTWTISGTSDDHIVLVTVQFEYSNRQLISDSGYTPDSSFMQLTGVVNGIQLTLTREDVGPIKQVGPVGVFTFTSTQMEGTWHDHWNGVWEQNVYTPTNGLKLAKQ